MAQNVSNFWVFFRRITLSYILITSSTLLFIFFFFKGTDPWNAFGDIIGVVLGFSTIFFTLLVLNDLRSGGHHLTAMLVVDLFNCGLLFIHVWWQSRKLIFAVDQTRFVDAVSSSAILAAGSVNSTDIPMNDVTKFIDLAYFLSWDQTALMVLGCNVVRKTKYSLTTQNLFCFLQTLTNFFLFFSTSIPFIFHPIPFSCFFLIYSFYLFVELDFIFHSFIQSNGNSSSD